MFEPLDSDFTKYKNKIQGQLPNEKIARLRVNSCGLAMTLISRYE